MPTIISLSNHLYYRCNPSLLNQTIYSYLNQLPHGDFYIRIDNQLNIDLIKDIISQGFKCCLMLVR